jgi:hypothetical protein
MDTAERVRENRLRRMADRQGLRLEKSRRRDPRAVDYGKYIVVDQATGAVVVGTGPIGRPTWDLDQVEAWLMSDPSDPWSLGLCDFAKVFRRR